MDEKKVKELGRLIGAKLYDALSDDIQSISLTSLNNRYKQARLDIFKTINGKKYQLHATKGWRVYREGN